MKVAVLCEFSGTVRNAFTQAGHEAVSCDILPTESPGAHIQADLRRLDWSGFDLVIAHPPCTHLAVSGARWWKDKEEEQREAIDFFLHCMNLPVDKICVENPVGIMSTCYRKPDQYIQPWQFGHGETKKTGLWLKGLDPLVPTDVVDGREARVHRLPPSPERWKLRSVFYTGIAWAMAQQWGGIV